MINLIIFLLILSVLILIHEFGHFIVAKKNGVKVEEFGLGIPPRIFGKQFGETIYSINALPFGGFVKLFGEDPDEITSEMKDSPKKLFIKVSNKKSFNTGCRRYHESYTCDCTVLRLLFMTGFKTLNLPVFFDYKFRFGEVVTQDTVVTGFSDESPAEKAGVALGEAILEIDGNSVSNIKEVREQVSDKPNLEVTLKLKDLRYSAEDKIRYVVLTPDNDDEGNGILGVYISESAYIYYPNKLIAPFEHSYNMLAYTGNTFGQFIKMAFETRSVEPVSSGVTGPVGIYTVVGSIVDFGGKDAVLGLLDFVALLSLSLAFINVLPLPALDGGRLLFVAVEQITGKRVNQKFETAVHKWGMIFFFGLLILITIKDIGQFLL